MWMDGYTKTPTTGKYSEKRKKKLLKTKTIVLGITKTAIQGKWEPS